MVIFWEIAVHLVANESRYNFPALDRLQKKKKREKSPSN